MWRMLIIAVLFVVAAGPASGGGNPELDLTRDWPEGYMPLADHCPKSFIAKWESLDFQDKPGNIGNVEFRADGTSVWQKHGTIKYRKLDGWVHDVLEMHGLFTDPNEIEGPYVVIAYPYLTMAGSGFICEMSLSTCPTLEEVNRIEIGDGYLAKCQNYGFFVLKP